MAARSMERGRDEGGERRERELGQREEASALSARGERMCQRARWSEDATRVASVEEASSAGGRRRRRDPRSGNESGGARDEARTRRGWRSQRMRALRAGGGICAVGARGAKVAAHLMERGRRRGWRAQRTLARGAGGGVGAVGARGTKVAARAMERGRDEGGKRRGRELGGREEARSARGERKSEVPVLTTTSMMTRYLAPKKKWLPRSQACDIIKVEEFFI